MALAALKVSSSANLALRDIPAPAPRGRPGWDHTLSILRAALAAADAEQAVRQAIQVDDRGATLGDATVSWSEVERVILLPIGKAAAPMARAAEAVLRDRVTGGVGVTVPELAGPTRVTTLHKGGHPLPDPGSLMAARHVRRVLEDVTASDLVLVLLSGGASALLEMPVPGVPLADLQTSTSALLASGATINEMNTVRKHLSGIKGGQLARLAAPAQLVTLIVSDVVGNPLDVIGSGPTVPDSTTYGDAAEIFSRYGLWGSVPASVADHIRAGSDGRVPETPKPDDPAFRRATATVIADIADSVTAAARQAAELGYNVLPLTSQLEGEAREAGKVLASVAKEVMVRGRPVARPACLLAGGETTVTLRHLGGEGGRNQELALSVAVALEGRADFVFAAMGTDGADGTTPAAGAIVDGSTVERARAEGTNPMDSLQKNDSGSLFEALGDQIVTGPTGTNVNDINVLLVM